MDIIKFGTDGWRAIIGLNYTVANVRRVAYATAQWMRNHGHSKLVIGHDCRFGGEMFLQEAVRIYCAEGVHCFVAKGYVSTPMVSLGTVKKSADLGIVITASHNPPSYNGYKVKSAAGGPAVPAVISDIEKLIPDQWPEPDESFTDYVEKGQVEYVDLESMYELHLRENIDVPLIAKSQKIAYDAMYGAGQSVMKRLLPDTRFFHSEENPGFDGQAPEPILRNLGEISAFLQNAGPYTAAFATDGDADRIGMFDGLGQFVDSHHLLLLLLHYLAGYRKMGGKVVVTFSVTDKMKMLADHYGLPMEITKIGFKYIAEIMLREDVLVAGEESGGLAIKGHIPERDGIWIGMTILEFMSQTGKSLQELISEVYDIVGSFSFDRLDLHLTESQISDIKRRLAQETFAEMAGRGVLDHQQMDGHKFFLERDSWVMIRPSGTEPVLRVYGQAPDKAQVDQLLEDVRSFFLA